ncbi:hypothetical protein ACER0A_006695 [Haloimpatiens sp. FM7315]|uniref:hypothetical protein n=1 Tax=Haloimpatiens sp. FM7315 TaxID=3298609 RepID=UPI00370A700A
MLIRRIKKNIGLVVGCIGLGILLAVIVPIWGWLLLVGAGLVGCGWFLTRNC